MPISPTELLDFISKTQFNIPKICLEIDEKLKQFKNETDVIFIVDINAELPKHIADQICDIYKKVGWAASTIGMTRIESGFNAQLHSMGDKITRFRFSV